ncbi:MAG: dTDP-4-dehydrorhamnose 3,5-epimerase, partial [Actinobacteria bacterium]|nr:dTDP-4-dehydrorhamnose 3,5-epimerase [Actinomycetota bacterium]
GAEPAVILNIPSEPYDAARPDEHRIAHDDPAIAFDWDLRR